MRPALNQSDLWVTHSPEICSGDLRLKWALFCGLCTYDVDLSYTYNVPVSSRSFSEPFPLVSRSEVCPGVAKVADPDVSVGVQHDVGGLEVAVENTGGEMEILQGEDQLYQIES